MNDIKKGILWGLGFEIGVNLEHKYLRPILRKLAGNALEKIIKSAQNGNEICQTACKLAEIPYEEDNNETPKNKVKIGFQY